ncbi:HpcH/HpaI aldolase/citrate lyase family protein [Iamia sp. SCSIO 61187]|uniref:HpcH/HpaI aldolase/citrate lyase family protein n=1 Tax=Iamia sp. SCSIO 61187 TaxID=2722752 RepID=UPI001C633765|nr:HpcH/HpaI aldolase/citrate lyase family protein [Iamia sp. SCSIO 61187]QYG91326.1 HpcH/HpaI aldolase/citrate lyase family protein [Iamia sp. SCSIO 61187]
MPPRNPFPDTDDGLWYQPPLGIAATDTPAMIGAGLGGTLYTPSIEVELSRKLRSAARLGAVSAVVCLEDSISDDDVAEAERNVTTWFRQLAIEGWDDLPLLFLRPRAPAHLVAIAEQLGADGAALVGVCLPKFTAATSSTWFEALDVSSSLVGHQLMAMPIIESRQAVAAETRVEELVALRTVLAVERHRVPAVRVGGSDLCGYFGVRRRADQTIYDIGPVAGAIADMVNILGRDHDGIALAGPVWEYFTRDLRIWKPQLRESLFGEEDEAPALRGQLLAQHMDGLIKEVLKDQANGLWGKTVIHPSHIPVVNALQAVSFEEWSDAEQVVATNTGGARKSAFSNKMNEGAPHRLWATKVQRRASAFGVLAEGHSFVSLLGG